MPSIEYFESYHPYDEHLEFLEDMVAAFPDNAEMIVAGESYEGRDIHGIHIWGKGGNTSTQAVYWHGTTHAREWISAMVSLCAGVLVSRSMLIESVHRLQSTKCTK